MPNKVEMLDHLANACKVCGMCDLGWTKHSREGKELDPQVPGYFDHMSTLPKIMVVGQNPGWNEVKQGVPFVGAAGEAFGAAIKKYGEKYSITRNWFYITNSVKCYNTDNRPPLQVHKDACEPFLRMEINIIRPRFIVALGAVAFETLCPGCEFITGTMVPSKYSVKVYPTYHPSPLNLQDKMRKEAFESDMRKLCELLHRMESPF